MKRIELPENLPFMVNDMIDRFKHREWLFDPIGMEFTIGDDCHHGTLNLVEGCDDAEYCLNFCWEINFWGFKGICLAEGSAEDIEALESPDLANKIVLFIRKVEGLEPRRVKLLEIPEGVTSLIKEEGESCYEAIREYDIIDKLVLPSTLRLETVESERYDSLIKTSFDVSHLEMYFSSYENPGFMTFTPVRCKRVQIGEIENRSPYLSIEDGVIYDADKTRLIFCYEEKTEFTVPESVKIIESHAFCDQSELKTITLPGGLEEIHDSAFVGCSSLESIAIPQGITKIYGNTFAGCVSLRDVRLPSGTKHLGADAFRHCDSLVEIDLPDSIESMDSFECCDALKRIVIPKGVTNVRGFAMCHSLKEVILHSGVREIHDYAFRCCEKLSKINLPEGLEEIGPRAFYPCHLTRAVFPATLKKIGCEAFYHNSRLRYIKFKSQVTIDQAAFACTPNLKLIRKLKGMKIPKNVFEEDKSLDKFAFWD